MNVLDIENIKRHHPYGPGNEGDHVSITLYSGFEIFNDTPYHNYETWAHGWRIEDDEVIVTAETLVAGIAVYDKIKSGESEPNKWGHYDTPTYCRAWRKRVEHFCHDCELDITDAVTNRTGAVVDEKGNLLCEDCAKERGE